MRSHDLTLIAAAAFLVVIGAAAGARAADLDVYRVIPALPTDGVPCESPEVQAFPSVWRGHFTGGYSHYLGPGHTIALDWRDETLCFPSRGTCGGHIAAMRRDFHRPEGYFTCLPIR